MFPLKDSKVNSCPSLPSLAMAREPFLGGNSMWLSNKSERIVAKDKISLHRLGKSWSRSHARPYCSVYLFTLIVLSNVSF